MEVLDICGIVGFTGHQQATPILLEALPYTLPLERSPGYCPGADFLTSHFVEQLFTEGLVAYRIPFIFRNGVY